jgi:ABC-type lipoprotein release transport system permease subunit
MAAVLARSRAELRVRWRSWLGLALVIGMAGGAVLALAAGARRTESAYPRLVAAERPPDVNSMLVEDIGERRATLDPAAVARLQQVAGVGRMRDFPVFDGVTGEGVMIRNPDYVQTATFGGEAVRWLERTKLLSGRLADPRKADETVVDFPLAERFGLRVGDTMRLRFTRAGEDELWASNEPPPTSAGRLLSLRVVGIVAPSGSFPPRPQAAGAGFAVLTPAFEAQQGSSLGGRVILAVWLRGGPAAVEGFARAAERLAQGAPFDSFAARAEDGWGGGVRTRRALGLLTTAVWLLAGLGATALLLVAGQALHRHALLEATEQPTLEALGMTREQLWGVAMVRLSLVAAAGAAVAVTVAVGLSPLFPLGLARIAEPNPGVALDGAALGIGVALLSVAVLAIGGLAAWRAARGGSSARRVAAQRRSAFAEGLGRASFPVTAVTGVGLALEPARGRTGMPVRSTIAGAMLAVATLAAAATFSAGLDHLLRTPRLFGWNWDITVGDGTGTRDHYDEVVPVLRSDPAVAEVAAGGGTLVQVQGGVLPAFSLDPVKGNVGPTVVEGRPPVRDGEIFVGTRTLRSLGARIGDTVQLRKAQDYGQPDQGAAQPQRFLVVGRGVLHDTGFAGFGEGFVLTSAGVARLDPTAVHAWFPLRWTDGVDEAAAMERLRAKLRLFPVGLQRPADVVNFGRVEAMPLAAGSLVALVAVAMLAHLLVTSVRRRRRDLAVLKTLGFARRQVSATVIWQATTLAGLAVLVGLPLGIAAGRWAWILVADRLGVVPVSVVPAMVLTLVALTTVLAANLVAAVPAWMAARTRPAIALRAE